MSPAPLSNGNTPTALAPVKRMQTTPRAIVEELNRYIVGQKAAKRAVAVALRNRWRRQQVPPPMRDEIAPKNIMLIGPTGVGKTEIARRLARLAGAPFVKVEASKFTEVGYVGRDVDSMVRDLAETAVSMLRDEKLNRLRPRGARMPKSVSSTCCCRRRRARATPAPSGAATSTMPAPPEGGRCPNRQARQRHPREPAQADARGKARRQDGGDRHLRLTGLVRRRVSGTGMEEMVLNLRDMMPQGARKTKRRRLPLPEALEVLTEEEAEKLIDVERLQKDAIRRAEQAGIIFIDEIDKVAGREGAATAAPTSRARGSSADILPIVEGSTVSTKYGPLKTDHVLFIAAGAFHVSKPKDLIPELQGRFPIRVELESLTDDDFVRILTEPENALTKQYIALLATEKVTLEIQTTPSPRSRASPPW